MSEALHPLLQSQSARPGPIVIRKRAAGGGVAVLSAPERSWVSLEFLADRLNPGIVQVAVDVITIGGVVDYRVTGWDPAARALTVELVADRRGSARRP